MFTYERPVRFEDVDAAQIVFFARYLGYCHEAMEAFFHGIPGGYVRLIGERHIGLPAVSVNCSYFAPLSYGDTAVVHVNVTRVGNTSCTFHYEFSRKADGVRIAIVEHVVVATDLKRFHKVPLPEDVRSVLAEHYAPDGASGDA